MKIALIGPVYPYRGGIAHHTSMLAQTLRDKHDVRVISFARQFPKRIYPGRTDIDPSNEVIRVEVEYLLNPFNPITWITTGQDIVKNSPDVIIIQWWVTIWGPALACIAFLCRRAGIPVKFMVHNVLPHEEHFFDRPIAKSTLRLGNAHVVHSKREQARLLDLIPGAKVKFVPHPPYDIFNRFRIDKEKARKILNLPIDAPIILSFGFVRAYKGLEYVIDAAAILQSKNAPIFLIIAGEFWQSKNLYLEQIRESGLEERTLIDDRYIPNEEVGIYFSAADVVVAPYLGGTQSGVAAAAMSFQLPLITTQHILDGIHIEESGNIYVVPDGDSQSIAQAIEKIIDQNSISLAPSRTYKKIWKDLSSAFTQDIEPN